MVAQTPVQRGFTGRYPFKLVGPPSGYVVYRGLQPTGRNLATGKSFSGTPCERLG